MYLKAILSLFVLLGPANTGVRTTEMLVPLPQQPVRSFSVTESEFVERLRKPLGRKKILSVPVKVEAGGAVKTDTGAVKTEPSAAVKTEPADIVKSEPRATIKSEGGEGKSASVSETVPQDSKSATEVGEAVASAVDYKIADEKNTREVPILLQLYRTPAGKLTAVRLRVPFDWRNELVAPGKLALSALVPSMNDKERRAATDLTASAHQENASFGMADYQHQEVLVKYTGWKDKTRDYAILDFCLPPQEESSGLEADVNETKAEPSSGEAAGQPHPKVETP